VPGVREVFDDIDVRLFVYLDDEDHLAVPAASKTLQYAEGLLAGELTIAELHERWADWHPVVEGFIVGYGIDELGGLFV
jgi:hypothetical protein